MAPRALVLAAAISCATASSAAGQVLLHHYGFDTNSTFAMDGVGGVHGSLHGGAQVIDGVLRLDGTSGYAELTQHIVPTSGSYSVAMFARNSSVQGTWIELISQGCTGCPGFYIGHENGIIRVTDSWLNTGVEFPRGDDLFHHFAIAVDAASNQTKLYLDGVLRATHGSAITTTSSGTHTRFGRQFDPYTEFFHGELDDIRIYSGALSDAQVANLAAGGTVTPEPVSMALLGTGLAGIAGVARRRRRSEPVSG